MARTDTKPKKLIWATLFSLSALILNGMNFVLNRGAFNNSLINPENMSIFIGVGSALHLALLFFIHRGFSTARWIYRLMAVVAIGYFIVTVVKDRPSIDTFFIYHATGVFLLTTALLLFYSRSVDIWLGTGYGYLPRPEKNLYQRIKAKIQLPTIDQFLRAGKLFYTRMFTIRGRSNRTETWAALVITLILTLCFTLLDVSAKLYFLEKIRNDALPLLPAIGFLSYLLTYTALYILVMTIPSVTLMIRRFHDMGYSGWQTLWYLFLPIFLWLIVFFVIVGGFIVLVPGLAVTLIAACAFYLISLTVYLWYLMYFKPGNRFRNSWGDPPVL